MRGSQTDSTTKLVRGRIYEDPPSGILASRIELRLLSSLRAERVLCNKLWM